MSPAVLEVRDCCCCPGQATIGLTLPSGACARLCDACVARNTRPAVYFVRGGDLVKIGYSAHVSQRVDALRIGSPVPLTLWYLRNGDRELERELHDRFADDRSHGEWFHVSDAITEFVADAWAQDWPLFRTTPSPGAIGLTPLSREGSVTFHVA